MRRGIEAWASDLGRGLATAGADVTLFAGAPGEGLTALPCLRRTAAANRGVLSVTRHLGGWRYGLGSPYDIEQSSFAVSLWRAIRRDFDILHAQDPAIARWLHLAHRRGLSRPRVVYANGTGEGPAVMRRFDHVQLLTQAGYDDWRPQAPAGQQVFLVPNFVDTAVFTPGDRAAARDAFGLPPQGRVLLCCAAIRRFHKRIDELVAAFAGAGLPADTTLVIAGGREDDTDAIVAEAIARLGDRVRFLPDLPRERMGDLYRAADAFALASLFEMFGIVLIEAMATGLPVLCHDTATFRSVVGPAGLYRDLSTPQGLAAGIAAILDPATSAPLAGAARSWVESRFATPVVIHDILAMYSAVLEDRSHG